jgi:hypothetical protein
MPSITAPVNVSVEMSTVLPGIAAPSAPATNVSVEMSTVLPGSAAPSAPATNVSVEMSTVLSGSAAPSAASKSTIDALGEEMPEHVYARAVKE